MAQQPGDLLLLPSQPRCSTDDLSSLFGAKEALDETTFLQRIRRKGFQEHNGAARQLLHRIAMVDPVDGSDRRHAVVLRSDCKKVRPTKERAIVGHDVAVVQIGSLSVPCGSVRCFGERRRNGSIASPLRLLPKPRSPTPYDRRRPSYKC